jgi:hypothetical protein
MDDYVMAPPESADIAKLYEELRSIIDGGSESFTHADAVQYLKDNLTSQQWTSEDMAYRPGGLAQSEQEPVAWMVYTQDGQSVYVTDNPTDIQEGQRALPLYTKAQHD